ncbi:hypothetical protein M758_1G078000 [Ceratodon purpureus]|uniref:Uncharacterized protein n=1 Tax=Ceratodon purpureus TaxID=3225 RepID=A0A8T0J5Y2_CERPU|nr:hypothetical protein KC19_1G079900 [Ceratodon purpureus]KAG0629118.1 hypothetical protein M758_1G078000 [Ceratodon purpureus]
MSTPFSTMRVMKPVAAIVTLTISYFTESWGTLAEHSSLNSKRNVFLTTLVAAGGLILSTMKSVAELMLLARTSALTYIVLLLLKDAHHILEVMVHAGWSSFFETRGGGGSQKQETIGFHYIAFGLVFFGWERYEKWSARGQRRSQNLLVPVQEVPKEESKLKLQ